MKNSGGTRGKESDDVADDKAGSSPPYIISSSVTLRSAKRRTQSKPSVVSSRCVQVESVVVLCGNLLSLAIEMVYISAVIPRTRGHSLGHRQLEGGVRTGEVAPAVAV